MVPLGRMDPGVQVVVAEDRTDLSTDRVRGFRRRDRRFRTKQLGQRGDPVADDRRPGGDRVHRARTEGVGDDRCNLDIERAMDGRKPRERDVAVPGDPIGEARLLQGPLHPRADRTITDHFEACLRRLPKHASDRPRRGSVDLVAIQPIHHADHGIGRDRTPWRPKDLERRTGTDDGIRNARQTGSRPAPFRTEHEVLPIGPQPGLADHTVTLDDRHIAFHGDPGDEVVPDGGLGRRVIVTEMEHLRPVMVEEPSNPRSVAHVFREAHGRSKPDGHPSGEHVMGSGTPRRMGEVDDQLLSTTDLQVRDRMQDARRRRS